MTTVELPDYYYSPSVWRNITFGMCCIRFDQLSDSGNSVVPYIHTNSSHHDIGIESCKVDWNTANTTYGDLILECEHGGAIGAMLAVPDETMSAKGIFVGNSGGGAKTTLKFYKQVNVSTTYPDGRKPIYAYSKDYMYAPNANLWIIYAWHSVAENPILTAITDLRTRLEVVEQWIANHGS